MERGGLRVQHSKTGRHFRLPASYVEQHTDLGYACTVHTAQGVTADAMHGLINGEESRQQLYTMLTRGRHANHVYLGVVGDGDPHTVIRPELLHPRTPTDILERVLARDASPKSATTLSREATDPAVRLGDATAAYTDALYLAAEKTLDPDLVDGLDAAVDQIVPGLTEEPAWPALRAHLLLLGTTGQNAVELLTAAAADRELSTAGDRAAVLDRRLDSSGLRSTGPDRGSNGRDSGLQPLPWLHATPSAIAQHPTWGPYLAQRAQLVTSLAAQVRERAESSTLTPAWANGARLDAQVVGGVEVWRAAMKVDPADRRPTGPAQPQKAASTWQRHLNSQVTGGRTPAMREWRHLLAGINPRIARDIDTDPFTPLLAQRLASMSRAGVNPRTLITAAAQAGPLPDDHPAAALWWRISRQVAPAVAARLDDHTQVTTAAWTRRLAELVGAGRAAALQQSPWWPPLVAAVDHGLQRGWELHRLLGLDPQDPEPVLGDVDECQAMVWRASIATHDIPNADSDPIWDDVYAAPHDLDGIPDHYAPTLDAHDWATVVAEGWKPTAVDGRDVPDSDEPEWDSNPGDDHTGTVLDWEVDRTLPRASLTVAEARLETPCAPALAPSQRWAAIAGTIDTRLIQQRDWPLLAGMIQEIADAGHDVPATLRQAVGDNPLDNRPARDLRLRLLSHADISIHADELPKRGPRHDTSEARRQQSLAPATHLPNPPRR